MRSHVHTIDQKVDDDVDLDALAGLTEGYSGADVAIVCRDAAMMSVRRVMKGALERGLSGPEIQKHVMEMKEELAAAVTMEDFRSSLRKVRSMCKVGDIFMRPSEVQEISGTNYNLDQRSPSLILPTYICSTETALEQVSKSVGQSDLDKYDEWMKEFGSA